MDANFTQRVLIGLLLAAGTFSPHGSQAEWMVDSGRGLNRPEDRAGAEGLYEGRFSYAGRAEMPEFTPGEPQSHERNQLGAGNIHASPRPLTRTDRGAFWLNEPLPDLLGEAPVPARAPWENRATASFTGVVDVFDWMGRGAQPGRTMVRVSLEDGRSLWIDLGALRDPESLRAKQNDFVRFLGLKDTFQGRPALRAYEVWLNGERVFARRTAVPPEREDRRFSQRDGTRSRERADDAIASEVRDEIRLAPELDAREIEVRVHDGVVILEGDIDSVTEKRLASALAREVAGVRGVRNEIAVRAVETLPPSAIGERVRRALREAGLDARHIRVGVNIGRVSLNGEVPSFEQRAAAEEAARKVEGVWGVLNNLRVAPREF